MFHICLTFARCLPDVCLMIALSGERGVSAPFRPLQQQATKEYTTSRSRPTSVPDNVQTALEEDDHVEPVVDQVAAVEAEIGELVGGQR